MKKLADECQRLIHINHLEAEGRPILAEEFYNELDRVCRKVWGYTPLDFDRVLIPDHDSMFEGYAAAEGVEFAMSKGYDMRMASGKPLHDWEEFIWMILAEDAGLLNEDAAATYRLKKEAGEFQERKRAGVIDGR